MASLPAQAVFSSAPVAGPSGSHPVPHGHHAHAYAHDIPPLPPQQDRLPPIRNLPPFRELDFQPYVVSQPQPASNFVSTQSGQTQTQTPPPPTQASAAYASGAQRARQQQQQQQQHSYGQVQQQHIPDSPALAQGQVPGSAPGVGGRGRTSSSWGAPPGIPRSPAPPHSAASSSALMMGAPQSAEYPQHHLPPPTPNSAGMGGTPGMHAHGHGSMMAGQQTQSLKRQRSESRGGGGGSAGAGSGLGGSGSSVSVSPAAGASGRSPHVSATVPLRFFRLEISNAILSPSLSLFPFRHQSLGYYVHVYFFPDPLLPDIPRANNLFIYRPVYAIFP